MAGRRYISGDVHLSVTYNDRGHYVVTAKVGEYKTRVTVRPAPAGFGRGVAYDSDKAMKEIARSGLSFLDDERKISSDRAEIDEDGRFVVRSPRRTRKNPKWATGASKRTYYLVRQPHKHSALGKRGVKAYAVRDKYDKSADRLPHQRFASRRPKTAGVERRSLKRRKNPAKRRKSTSKRDWKPTSGRLVHREGSGVGEVKVYRDSDWQEYVVVPPGAKSDKRAAFTDDREDAIAIAKDMHARGRKTNGRKRKAPARRRKNSEPITARQVRRMMDARQSALCKTQRYLRASEGKRGEMANEDWWKFSKKLEKKYGYAVVEAANNW